MAGITNPKGTTCYASSVIQMLASSGRVDNALQMHNRRHGGNQISNFIMEFSNSN